MLNCISLCGFDETDRPGTLLSTEIPMTETQIQTLDNSYQLLFKGLQITKVFNRFDIIKVMRCEKQLDKYHC